MSRGRESISTVSIVGQERIRTYNGVDADELELVAAGAAALLAIRHPHLYPVHAIDADDALSIRGPVIHEVPTLPPIRDHILGLIAQAAQAVGALHQRSIAHLGVSQSALGFLDEDGWGLRAILVDSELSRPLGAPLGADAAARVPFPAPELRAGRFDIRSDVYGLGQMLLALLPPSVSTVDAATERLVFRMLAGDPDQRPSRIDDVLDELARLGWQRTMGVEAQPNDHVGHQKLLIVRPSPRTISLDRRRANVWTLGWVNDDFELWKYQNGWFLAPRRDRNVRLDSVDVHFPDRVPLRIGQVVASDDVTFLLAPLAEVAERTAPWESDQPDRRSPTDTPLIVSGDRVLVPGPTGLMQSATVLQLLQGYYELDVGDDETIWVPVNGVVPEGDSRTTAVPATPLMPSVPTNPLNPTIMPGVLPPGFGPPPTPNSSVHSSSPASVSECKRCGKENLAHYRFCLGCGAELEVVSSTLFSTLFPATTVCALCDHKNPSGCTFCLNCGGAFGAPVPAGRPPHTMQRRMLGDWEIIDELGSGAITEVFRVRRLELTGVAKRLLAEACANPVMQMRFERESASLRELRHVAIPRLFDHGTDFNDSPRVGGLPFFIMEDVGNETLEIRLGKGPLGVTDAVVVARDVLAALDAAHGKKIIHRDLKPSNVVFPQLGGFAKLLGFGVAHVSSDGRSEITGTGVLVGTPAYMSPEQVRGDEVTPASDVYAAGCLLYEMLAGSAPYAGLGVAELVHAHVHVPPARLPSRVPDELAAIVLQMLAKDPSRRPSCREARESLVQFVPAPSITIDPDTVETEAGIWRRARIATRLDHRDEAWSIAIHETDRRDGPRLRLHTLRRLDEGRRVDGVAVTARSREGGWWVFDLVGPPRLPRVLEFEPAVVVFVTILEALQSRGGHRHRVTRSHVRGIIDPIEDFHVVLDVFDDDTLLASHPESRDCIATQCRLLFELLDGTERTHWPDRVVRLQELFDAASQDRELHVPFDNALVDLARVAAAWRNINRRDEEPPRSGTMPQFAAPPELPLALPVAAESQTSFSNDLDRRFGNWRAVRLLGQGGMGCVYEVEHAILVGRRAVAKTLTVGWFSDQQMRTRFVDEARAVNTFRHPNVIDIFDIGDDQGVPYIVMEYLSGESLASRIRRQPLAVREAIEIMQQMASGLSAAHAAGVIHRDIKPNNIVFTGDGRVKILDFGIARVPRSEYQTPTNVMMGTPAYMSPEQWRGAGYVDARSDIFALGVTLFEMISGTTPFTGESIADFMAKITNEPAPALTSPLGTIPQALLDLVGQMLCKDPAGRPQSCEELLRQLDEIAPPPATSVEAELARAGFTHIVSKGTTSEAIPRYLARDTDGPVKIYIAQPDLRGVRAMARIAALAYLAREQPPLFLPITREVTLLSRATAYVRRDPVPRALEPGVPLDVGPALAVAAVAFRALVVLRANKRRFENFGLPQIRADVSTPDAFDCMLQPPQVFDLKAAEVRTNADEPVDNIIYQSPDGLVGDDPYDAPYAVGILSFELLSGRSPFADLRSFELYHRKMSEDPPLLTHASSGVGDFVNALIARDRRSRARTPALIEAELLALLDYHPEWRIAADRVLARAPSLAGVMWDAYPQGSRSASPTLAPGDRVRSWTVAAHLRFGGDAEVYLVTDAHAQRAVLKLWYADGIDPYSTEWDKFRRGMFECAKLPGFPAVREIETIARGRRPRAFAVFEEIVGKDWRTLVKEGRGQATFVLDVTAQLLATLHEAHGLLGIVGDVSPTNVIVRDDASNAPILLDVMTPNQQRDKQAGYGTPGYVAPEVTNGETPSRLSDVFSAGVLVAELALGQRLFPDIVEGLSFPVGGFEAPIARALAAARELYGATFAGVLARMLAIDPSRRYTSARAASEELREIGGRVRVRALSQQMSDSTTLLGLERRLPRPVAQALRSWRIAEDSQWRARFGFGLAELVTRYLASIALADYLSGKRIESVEKELQGLRRPSFGTWLSIARTTARALGDRGSAFVPELVELFAPKSPGLAAIEELIPMRNKYSHGIPVIPEGELPDVLANVTRHVRALLVAIRFLGSYPLLVNEEQQLRNTRFDGLYLDLHGTAGEPEHRRLQTAQAIQSNVVMMTSPDLQERLILEPFILHRPCKACGAISHTYVLADAPDKGDVKYVDQLSGHEHRERPNDPNGAACGFFDLLAMREQLALRGPLMVTTADGERFWRGDSPVKPGQDLDGVVLEEEIGRGAMGVVYRARDKKLDRPCAVKIVRPEVLGEDRKPLHQLEAEARKLSRLEHPHVVRVLQFGVMPDESNCFIVMELLEGGSLEDRLRSGPPLSFEDVLGLGRQLLDAVQHMHAADIVHRDLKPANVLFASRANIKIVDFGMARDLRATSTRSVGFGGATPHYCSPEQLVGGAIGPWTDVYALGLLLYDLAVGQPASLDPQRRTAAIRTAMRQLRKGTLPDHLSQHASDARLAGFLEALIAMTELEPDRRPSIAGVRFDVSN